MDRFVALRWQGTRSSTQQISQQVASFKFFSGKDNLVIAKLEGERERERTGTKTETWKERREGGAKGRSVYEKAKENEEENERLGTLLNPSSSPHPWLWTSSS